MEEKDYDLIAVGLLRDLSDGLNDSAFNYVIAATTLTILMKKGIITEEEFRKESEAYKKWASSV